MKATAALTHSGVNPAWPSCLVRSIAKQTASAAAINSAWMLSASPDRAPKNWASTRALRGVVITPLPSDRPPSHTTEASRFIINPRIAAGFVSSQYLVAGMSIVLGYGGLQDRKST